MASPENGNGSTRLVLWIATGLGALVLALATALANDMRSDIGHNQSDITSLQASEAATRQALDDIRRDLQELLKRDRGQR